MSTHAPVREHNVEIGIDSVVLRADLAVPPAARGLVLFAHGSGSSRLSPRNRSVADVLNESGLATLLLDLLTGPEEHADTLSRQYRFDIDMLGERLRLATEWAGTVPQVSRLPVGYFGASTGAAAALVAAAKLPDTVRAVVSRGGRPDLADWALDEVRAPTLLIVGGADPAVLELNVSALARLRCNKALEVVPGATHLFEEPGTLERVGALAADWFQRYLPVPRQPPPTGMPW